jgi:hypothetical protein
MGDPKYFGINGIFDHWAQNICLLIQCLKIKTPNRTK